MLLLACNTDLQKRVCFLGSHVKQVSGRGDPNYYQNQTMTSCLSHCHILAEIPMHSDDN